MRHHLLTLSLLGVTACTTTDIDLSEGEQEIVNGYIDNTKPHVVKVADRCTGTLVGPRTVVTAGHCVSSGERVSISGKYREFDPEFRRWITIPFSRAGTATPHPGWNGQVGSTDAAVVILDVGVFDFSTAKLAEWAAAGTGITISGYGYTSSGGNDYGFLRSGTNQIDTVDNPLFTHTGATGSDATICFGDSGGPAFVGSSTCMIGITSATHWPYCTSAGGLHQRVDLVAPWIRANSPDVIPGC